MDREKVQKGLYEAINVIESHVPARYIGFAEQACYEAIALLKEQKQKQVEAEVINEIDRLYRCPSCHISMILRKQPYCHSCGQELKWE